MLRLPKTDVSFWRQSAPKARYPKIKEDIEVDVAVVGGGIAGLSSAYQLKRAGKSVAVIEKGEIGSGTSGHTTGKVTSQHGLIYDELQQRLGAKAARIYGQANQDAVEQIAKVVAKEKIDCGFTRADNYVFTTDEKQVEKFKAEARTAERLGLPATFESKSPLPFAIAAAVRFKNQAYMNAQAYLGGLASKVDGSGSYVFENSRAIVIRGGSKPKVRTKEASINANDVIVATNVPTFPLLARGSYCAMEYPHMSYIVACEAKKYPAHMYISPDKDHYSILPIDHAGRKLLLVGGSNHIPGVGFGADRHYRELAEYAEKKFGATSVKFRWKARDYMAYDSLPLVGQLYRHVPRLYVVTAFRKWGLSNSMVSATLLRDLVLGVKNPMADVLDPYRSSVKASIPHTIAESLT
jgi:glycine/D-amino acid oxidase-like deaminating enzyme